MDKTILRALPLMLVAMVLIPIGDMAGKLLTADLLEGGQGVAPVFVAWSRFALGAGLIAPFVLHLVQLHIFTDWRIWLRGLMLAGGITSILTALSSEPIANVFGAFFVGPILSWLLSVWLLREPFSALRFGLICLGFVGVMLVVKPGFGMTPGMGFAVLAGLFYGAYLVMSRWMADVARPRAMLFSQLVIGALVLGVPGISAMPSLTLPVVTFTLISAVCSMLGNLLLIMAYRKAEASLMAPFVYTQLIWATLLGAMVFGAIPDGWALAGIALLLVSGFASLAVRKS